MHPPETSQSVTSETHLPDWIDIWVNPRSAGRRIAKTRSVTSAVLILGLATLVGILVIMAFGWLWGEPMPLTREVLLQVPLSVVLVSAFAIFNTFATTHAGRRIGGQGSRREIFIATSWTLTFFVLVSTVVASVLFAIVLMRHGGYSYLPHLSQQPGIFIVVVSLAAFIALFAAVMVGLVAYVNVVAELHQIDMSDAYWLWRSAGKYNVILVIIAITFLACRLFMGM